MSRLPASVAVALATLIYWASARAEELTFKDRLLRELVQRVPEVLESYQPETGRFVTGRAWDQRSNQRMFPLAVVYTTKADFNSRYHDAALLDIIIKSGHALIDAQDNRGRWLYTKSNGSTWGWRWQEWTYSRWVDTFEIIRDDMPEADRNRWQQGLELAFTHMDRYLVERNQSECVDNHRAEMAAAIFAAGQVLNRPDWREHAAAYMKIIVEQQSPNGYWSEGGGPVILYNFEYIGSLGRYYARSHDEVVLSALERAVQYHYRFTYPDGSAVETIDQRNPFTGPVNEAWEAFSLMPVGRAYLKRQWTRLDPEQTARMIVMGEEGTIEPLETLESEHEYIMRIDGVPRAAIIRQRPWYICLSAIVTPQSETRWYCDRQNFVSIYHDRVGLILGGGNTKMQPAWSNFTVGDTSKLRHTPGDDNPVFTPQGLLYHIPYVAEYVRRPQPGLSLGYGPEYCHIQVELVDDHTLDYVVGTTREGRLPVAAHLTLMPQPRREQSGDAKGPPIPDPGEEVGKAILQTAAGYSQPLGKEPFDLAPERIGDWIQYSGYRLHVPAVAGLHWPALPHNPYRKGGEARIHEGRIEVRIPFDEKHSEYRLRLEVLQ